MRVMGLNERHTKVVLYMKEKVSNTKSTPCTSMPSLAKNSTTENTDKHREKIIITI